MEVSVVVPGTLGSVEAREGLPTVVLLVFCKMKPSPAPFTFAVAVTPVHGFVIEPPEINGAITAVEGRSRLNFPFASIADWVTGVVDGVPEAMITVPSVPNLPAGQFEIWPEREVRAGVPLPPVLGHAVSASARNTVSGNADSVFMVSFLNYTRELALLHSNSNTNTVPSTGFVFYCV
jgi:hypothetical protein